MSRRRIVTVALLAVLVVISGFLWHFTFRTRMLKLFYPRNFTAYVEKYAHDNRLDASLVYAVIKCESGFDKNAVSDIGARGLMQLTPETFDWAQSKTAEDETYTCDDLYNPEVNIRYGTLVLSSLIEEFGSVDTALAAYHAGRSRVKGWLADRAYSRDGKTLNLIPFADTRVYVKKVLEARDIYRSLYGQDDKNPLRAVSLKAG